MQRYLTPRGTAGQGTETDSESRAGIGDFESRSVKHQYTIAFDAAQITSKINGSNPQWNDPCHTISKENAGRATVIVHSAGFFAEASAKAGGIGYESEISATIRAGQTPSVICIQGKSIGRADKNAPNGSGINEDVAFTLNTVDQHAVVYAIGNGQADNTGLHNMVGALNCMHDQQAVVYAIDRAAFNQGENAKYDFEISDSGVNSTLVSRGPSAVAYGVDCRNFKLNENLYPTLQAKEGGGTSLNYQGAVCYNICSDASNAMQSDNPHSGIYETETTRTLDGNGGNPACNQGGTVICQRIIEWIVRRLTPRECERLQGYPDGWTVLPKISDMSEADYLFFRNVFCLDREINGKSVKKLPSKPQIIKWYNKLDSDSRRYKALGNSLAIPCALRVIGGIAEYMRKENTI